MTKFDNLSEESQMVAKEMIEFCINHGYRMGMDEGMNPDGTPKNFRTELEKWSTE